MHDVHGVADLPGLAAPSDADTSLARDTVAAYFGTYEQQFHLPLVRPVQVARVERDNDLFRVEGPEGTWLSRTLVNATGTWTHPFIPYYLGARTFTGRQIHTVDYPGPDAFAGQRVLVVGGGASAVQFLGELAGIAETLWVTRRPPVWRDAGSFDQAAGRAAVALVEARVREGYRPQSVVSVTGLALREQERRAEALGAYDRKPMFARIEPSGVRWPDGHFEHVDAIVWATGFRPAIAHLAPLHLRDERGGIRLDGTTAVADPRVQLVGYGPSASTIGANRAGRSAAIGVTSALASLPMHLLA